MVTSVRVERYKDYEELMHVVSYNEACPATTKSLVRPLNYELLGGSHLPEPDLYRLGALVALLFRDPKVVDVEIWRIGDGDWIADSLIKVGRGRHNRRGEGETPLQAFINLVYNIQRY